MVGWVIDLLKLITLTRISTIMHKSMKNYFPECKVTVPKQK